MSQRVAGALFCLLIGTSAARATDPAAGTGGAAFMKVGVGSARALAMGRSYVSLAEGTEAITWNPAGLALAQQREWSYSYYRYIQDIESPMYMAYSHPLGRTVLGANIAYMSMVFKDGELRDTLGRPMEATETKVQNGFATMSIARSFWYEKVFLGASLKGVYEDNAGSVHDVVVGDVGALLKPNSYISFGFAEQNLGASTSRIARITRVGASMRVMGLLTPAMEITNESDGPTRLGLGAEFLMPEELLQVGQIYLRIGYRSTDDLGQALERDRSLMYPLVGSPKLSFGLGLFTTQAFGYGLSFDYALVSYGALGMADMMTLKVKF